MARLFGKQRRPEGEGDVVQDADKDDAAATESKAAVTRPPARAFPMPRRYGSGSGSEGGGIELRAPTPEEISAPILFENELVSLDQLLAPKKPPMVPDKGPVAAAPTKQPAALIGFFEHFDPGNFLAGWVGDPDDPDCRTLRVAVLVDGMEMASATADRAREDTVYAGFLIDFADAEVAGLILDGRLQLLVTRDGRRAATVPVLPQVFDQARLLRPSVESPAELPAAAASVPAPAIPAVIAPVPASAADISAISVPVGMLSRDNAAIVGRQGFLFEYGGERDLIGQYRADPGPEGPVQPDAIGWFNLFRDRQAMLAERGIAFVQTIIPDKATALTGLAPGGLGPITPRLGVLETMIETVREREGADALAFYRSLVGALRSAHAAGIKPYLRIDSALSSIGTQMVFHQLVQKMGQLLPAHASQFSLISEYCGQMKPGRESDPFTGDLGAHFDFPLYESETIPNLSKLREFVIGKPALARILKGTNRGMRLMWSNPKAPSGLRVMAFGSSAFGTGSALRSLSWWCKTMFAEFHFVWDTEINPVYIDQHKPDLVICQGIEALMPAVPTR